MSGQECSPRADVKATRLARLALLCAVVLVAVVGLAEAPARVVLGLGDPPLFLSDSQLEYRHKPGAYRRFGNELYFNESSMRSGPLGAHKLEPAEYRVLVLGDSVINGGSVLDDRQLVTTLLARALHARLERPVYVGNISAGSWGPTNQAAYLRKFGWFDADLVVLVESGHDLYDASTFEPVVGVGSNYPSVKPWSALWEGYQRYWPGFSVSRVLRRLAPQGSTLTPAVVEVGPSKLERAQRLADAARCREAFQEIGSEARRRGVPVLMVLFWERDRLDAAADPDHQALQNAATAMGAQVFDTKPEFLRALGAGASLYRPGDLLHPSAEGHRLLADILTPVLVEVAMAQAHGAPIDRTAE